MKPLETHLKTSEFISKLVDMMDVNYEIIQKFPSHIGWSKGGDEVIVSQLQELEETVLPVYFRHKKLTSFIRQVTETLFSSICMDFARRNRLAIS